MYGFTPEEMRIFTSLSTPSRIQDYLDALPINHEKQGETCMSPRRVLREQKAHCLEGALFACAALMVHKKRPLVLHLKTTHDDDFHAITVYKTRGYWGAISKTNHAVLRYRDPVYHDIHALVLSYFHEYFLQQDGKKTLRAYAGPLSLRRFGTSWLTSEEEVWPIADYLATQPHHPLFPASHARHLRPASSLERLAAETIEWTPEDPRT